MGNISTTSNGSTNIKSLTNGSGKLYAYDESLNQAVHFVSDQQFYLYIERKWVGGTLDFYNGDKKEWQCIDWFLDGQQQNNALSKQIIDNNTLVWIPAYKFPWGYAIYVRGWGNKSITGYYSNGKIEGKQWKFSKQSGSFDPYTNQIAAGGNLQYLIRHDIDWHYNDGWTPALEDGCFAWMFLNFYLDSNQKPYKLISAPALPTSSDIKTSPYCYLGLFYDCLYLQNPPKLTNDLQTGCFKNMFTNCTSLIKTPTMPNTNSVPSYAFNEMFKGCTSLQYASTLPATTVNEGSYAGMFYLCSALKTPPKIKATNTAIRCFHYMFQQSGLTSAPALPSGSNLNLAASCFDGMFALCTSLKAIPIIEGKNFGNYCCSWMFNGCTNIKISTTETNDYVTEWKITGSSMGTGSLFEMFKRNASPSANTTYYLHKDNYIVHF